MTSGPEEQESGFHVLLEGRKVGPYNRRTIVGMRIRNTLTSEHMLVGNDGAELTVADLIGLRPPEAAFNASRSGMFSVVRATYGAALGEAGRGPLPIPKFRGEIEVRVQNEVLRLAGKARKGFGWKDERIKIPLRDIAHARIRGSLVDLWVRSEGTNKLQRAVIEMFTPLAAGDLVEWLPNATAFPQPPRAGGAGQASTAHGLWVAITSIAIVLGTVLMVLLWPRVH